MFPYAKPRNAEEAYRQIRIAERAEALKPSLAVGGEYYTYQQGGTSFYGVYKRTYTAQPDICYLVDMEALTCTCPDFEAHLDFCKHLIALYEVLEEEAQEERMEAEAVLMASAECATGTDPYYCFDH